MSSEKQPIKSEAILLTGVIKVIEVVPYSLHFLKKMDWEDYSRGNGFNKALRPLLNHSAVKETIKTTNKWKAKHENLSYRIHQYVIKTENKKSKKKTPVREELRDLVSKVNDSLTKQIH